MPYVPSKKTDGKSDDRIRIDEAVELLAKEISENIKNNSDLIRCYIRSFVSIGQFLIPGDVGGYLNALEFNLATTINKVAEKYNYEGAFLGELNYAITRLIQRVPVYLRDQQKCGLVEGKELRYWLYAMTVTALTKAAYELASVDTIGVSGVFEDIKDEYKRRVNTAYEVAQIIKSGDCYDTPYLTQPAEVVDEAGKVVGHIEVMKSRANYDGKDVSGKIRIS